MSNRFLRLANKGRRVRTEYDPESDVLYIERRHVDKQTGN